MSPPAVSPDTAVFFYQKGVFYLINENKIRILYVQPGKHPEKRFAMNKLRTLQQLVGGDMQAVYPWSKDDVALICYEKLFRDPELFLPTPIGIMGIALSIEHGQGYSCRSHILAAVPWRIVAASLEQLQHYCPVSKFRGGFGCGICICVAQIVAVGGVVISLAVAYDFTNIIATSDFAVIIAVENSSGKIITADTAGVATAGDVADVIAIADYCHRT